MEITTGLGHFPLTATARIARPPRDINLATVDGKELPAVAANNALPNGSVVVYRATQHLDSYILLTSKQKFPRLVGRYYSYLLPTQALSTFNLMSTEYRNKGAVSPCSSSPKKVLTIIILLE